MRFTESSIKLNRPEKGIYCNIFLEKQSYLYETEASLNNLLGQFVYRFM